MDGIIVGSDQTLEWALPWWWDSYRKYNSYPVAFVDLGLSFEKKNWCRERGILIPLRIGDFTDEVASETAQSWEKEFGTHFWESRNAWFKKPLACLKSPFDRSIWIDIDCEIRSSLAPLFEYGAPPLSFGMAIDLLASPLPYPTYNSGVIVFTKNHPLLEEWGEICIKKNGDFPGDQEALSYLIDQKKIPITALPPCYNWSRRMEEKEEIVICHWHGHHGKRIIKHMIESNSV